jgi:beta-lactamase class A
MSFLSQKTSLVWLAVGLVVGAIAGFFLGNFTKSKDTATANATTEIKATELRSGGYKFINPLLECDNFSPSNDEAFAQMKGELESYISNIKGEGKASHVSIYYRDLNNGPAFGIDATSNYSPASLLKVPVMLAAFKKAESDPSFLKKKFLFDRHLDDVQPNILDTGLVKMGKSYTVEELMYKMIAYSDNDAKNLILINLPPNSIENTLVDVGLMVPDMTNQVDIMSVKDYASFFRMLYNATYLNRTMSEKALEILAAADFKQGLVAGVPDGIVVAHKFGERGFADNNIKQLHDCGIVYAPTGPYLVCVMTRGTSFDVLDDVIAGASAIVYKNLTAQ